jgi:predicted MFS family arabinose efflux permease
MRAPLLLAAVFLVLFVGGGARFAIALALKPMVSELGSTRADLSLAVGVYFVVSALATYVAGRLADRTSPRMLLGAGVIASGIGIGLMMFATRPSEALALYGVVFGIGSGFASLTPVGVIVTRAFPARTGFANAAVISGTSVGQLVIVAVLAGILASIGWRWSFGLLALAYFVLLPLLAVALPRHGEQRLGTASHGLDVGGAARTPSFWLLLAIYAICGFDDFFVSTHVVAFAQDHGVDALLAGNLLALMGLAALAGVLATGLVSDRSGPMRTTALTFAVRVALFALIAVDQSGPSIALFSLAFGATFLVTAPLTVLFVREHFGTAHLGALTGLITMVHQVFGGLGAYGGGLVFDATGGYALGFNVMLAASGLALALTLLLPVAKAPR